MSDKDVLDDFIINCLGDECDLPPDQTEPLRGLPARVRNFEKQVLHGGKSKKQVFTKFTPLNHCR